MDQDPENNMQFAELKELYYCNKDCNKELLEALDVFKASNDASFSSRMEVQNKIAELYDDPHGNNINVLYVDLKEDYEKLKKSYDDLDEKYKNLEQNHQTVLTVMKKEYEVKSSEFEETIVKLKNDLEKKGIEFFNEMHRSQATSDFRYDEMESSLQSMLSEMNQKLRESNNVNNVLRSQLYTLKSDYSRTLENTEQMNNKKIQELEDKIVFTENQLRIARDMKYVNNVNPNKYMRLQLNDDEHSIHSTTRSNNYQTPQRNIPERDTNSVVSGTNNPEKDMYHPLDIQVSRKENEGNSGSSLYKVRRGWAARKNENLPPLQQITNKQEKKKRKFYSPTKFVSDLNIDLKSD